jgi:hypothetical protein
MSKGDPVTYEELMPEHKQKFDEVKALFEANLIRSFERTRHHDISWKGFSPEGTLDGVDLSLPSEEHTRAPRQEVVIPRSEIAGTKPPYVCPGCFIHMYSNNMINRLHVQ